MFSIVPSIPCPLAFGAVGVNHRDVLDSDYVSRSAVDSELRVVQGTECAVSARGKRMANGSVLYPGG